MTKYQEQLTSLYVIQSEASFIWRKLKQKENLTLGEEDIFVSADRIMKAVADILKRESNTSEDSHGTN